jgi:hypothetical protein
MGEVLIAVKVILHMLRFFSVDQATALLPMVERHLRDALFARNEYRQAEESFTEVRTQIMMAGGSMVDRDRLTRIVAQKGGASVILQQEMDSLEAFGVQVKDLDIGLIDFSTRYRGAEVLLCWKFGEERITHWHGLTEGFQGRKEIDSDFLAEHSGDPEA